MNKNELEAAMKRHGDTGATLSAYLGIARSTFSAKINETNGAEFTQGEISLIKKRYSLDANAVDMIFLIQKCLKKTHFMLQPEEREATSTQKEGNERNNQKAFRLYYGNRNRLEKNVRKNRNPIYLSL